MDNIYDMHDIIMGMQEDNQVMIEMDYMECTHCGNIIFDEYEWIVPKCDNCNLNSNYGW